MKKLNVVAAIINENEKILCVQRPEGGEVAFKWEFPGGKIEDGETPEVALVREIKEELNCDISVGEFLMTVEHQYMTFHLTMHCYDCRIVSGKITLHEHIDSRWLPVSELQSLDWAPADWPIVDRLYKERFELIKKPEVFTPGDSFLWTDPYIAEQMLKAHLDPGTDSASRRPETIMSIVEFNIQKLGLKPGDKILDAGCGPGLYCEKFAEYGLAVTGLDISYNSIAYARESSLKKKLDIRYVCGNYLEMDFTDEFDAVFMIWWDFCVLNHEERSLVLSNIKRALRPGGRFVFDVSTPEMIEGEEETSSRKELENGFFAEGPHILLENFYKYPEYSLFLNQFVVIEESGIRTFRIYHTNYTVDTITGLLDECGFSVEDIYEDLQGTILGNESKSLGVYAVLKGDGDDQG